MSILSIQEKWIDFQYLVTSKQFIKLFFTILFALIIPFISVISFLIYSQYKESLSWNSKFQLVRIQLLAIDIENSIRDELSIDKRNQNLLFKVSQKSEIEAKCSGKLPEFNSEEFLKLTSCSLDGTKKSFLVVFYENEYYLYSSDFLEDNLLDSKLNDPNESLFIMNTNGSYGISGFIEEEFKVSKDWIEVSLPFLQSKSHIATMREISMSNTKYFVVSFPLYGLPLQLFLVSPKQILLNPIFIDLERNLYFLILIIFISLFLSGLIAKRENESKQTLELLLKEFPNAAILYDSAGKILLINPSLTDTVKLQSLYRDQKNLLEMVNEEVKLILNENQYLKIELPKIKKEEIEVYDKDNLAYLIQISIHIWHLTGQKKFARGAFVILEDTTGKRLEFLQEMDYARDLQKRYLPQKPIFPKGLDYEVYYAPLLQVGGDYYDFIQLDENRTIFAIGDIIGHGIQAAMMMTVVRVLFHQILKETNDPIRILSKMNDGVSSNLPRSYAFVPFMFLIFDFGIGKVLYANAGHPGMLYYTNTSIFCPEKLNPMLGMIPSYDYKILEYPIQKGDRFFLFTDGLRDIKNQKNLNLSEGELERFFSSLKDKHLSIVKSELELKIKTFGAGATYADDVTWMGIEVI